MRIKIRKAEQHLGEPLLIRRTGGHGGGDSHLTPQAQHLLKVFEQINRKTQTFAKDLFDELY